MAWWWAIQLAIAVAMAVVSVLLAPRPKQVRPEASRDLESPTADTGRPIPVVFGSMEVRGGNIIWYGDKRKIDKKVSA